MALCQATAAAFTCSSPVSNMAAAGPQVAHGILPLVAAFDPWCQGDQPDDAITAEVRE